MDIPKRTPFALVLVGFVATAACPALAAIETKDLADATRDSLWNVSWNAPDANGNTSAANLFQFTGIAMGQRQGTVFFDVTFMENKEFIFTFTEDVPVNGKADDFGLRLTMAFDVHNMTDKAWMGFRFELKDLAPLNAEQAARIEQNVEGNLTLHPTPPHFHNFMADGDLSIGPFNDPFPRNPTATNPGTTYLALGGGHVNSNGGLMQATGIGLHNFVVSDIESRSFELRLVPIPVPEMASLATWTLLIFSCVWPTRWRGR
jgi:hypothetical protein